MFYKIKEFFFKDEDAFNLQAVKLIICATLLVFAGQSYEFLQDSLIIGYEPIGIFKYLPQVTDKHTLNFLAVAYRLFLLLAILNICTQISLISAYFFGIYTLIYKYNFGTVYHGNWAIMFGLFILCFVPNSAWKKGYRGVHSLWPLRLIQISIAWIYTSAGLQKIMRSGFDWLWSDSLAVRIFNNKMTWSAKFLLDSPPEVLRVIQLGVVLIEITSLTVFLNHYTRKFYVLSWILLHIGIQITFSFHYDFLMNIAMHTSFISWNVLYEKWIHQRSELVK